MSVIDYIQLSYIKGIGNRTLKLLINTFGNPENIFQLSFEELSSVAGKKAAQLILNRDQTFRRKAEEEVLKAEKLGVNITCINAPDYPELLKEIPDPPIYLYYRGKVVKNKAVSIVGSRKHSSYGKTVTQQLVRSLVAEGVNIVSGMALGIDSIAHKTAIKNAGITTAILGSGIDIVYPYENRKLYEEIQENGTIISEFPIGTPPNRYNFPYRNRIVAGMSYATVITEASLKSGALITAKLANDYGRVVISIPANINNILAKGNNTLIKEGAIPLTEIEEIYEHIPYLKSKDKKDISLSDEEKKVLSVLHEPMHIDNIVDRTGIPVTELMIILFDMKMKGVVASDNNIYIRLL